MHVHENTVSRVYYTTLNKPQAYNYVVLQVILPGCKFAQVWY